MKKIATSLVLGLIIMVGHGCAFTKVVDYNGLRPYGGKKAVQVQQTNIDLTLLFKKPLIGDASLQTTLDQTGAAAKAKGAKEIRTFQAKSSTLWYAFPPISFVVHPVVTTVGADGIIE
jgi:hypothetical protein